MPSESDSTVDVVQNLQAKLRNTRENLERLRIDPSQEEEGIARPHALTETITNQLRLINQERQSMMEELGVDSGEKLPEAISRMKEELELLRNQTQGSQSSEAAPAVDMTHFSMKSGAPEQLRAAHPETVLQQALREKAEARLRQASSTPSVIQPTIKPSAPAAVEAPEVTAPEETSTAELSPAEAVHSALEKVEQLPPTPELKETVQPAVEMKQLLAQLDVPDLTSARIEIEQMKSMLDESGNNPKVRELMAQNEELSSRLNKMRAEQQAICKRFKVNSLTDLAKLMLQQLAQQKEMAQRLSQTSETDLSGSWAAIANMLQGWDESLNDGDPQRSVNIQRSEEGWVVSANWKDKKAG